MTLVKICGIRELDHALVAAQAGADFIGLVLVPERRRRLDKEDAWAIVSGLKTLSNNPPQVVGLFADQSLEEVNSYVRDCQLDLVQLCGQESLDYCGGVEAQVVKVMHVSNPSTTLLRKGGQEQIPPFDKGGSGGISEVGNEFSRANPDVCRLAEQVRSFRDAGHLVTLDRKVDGLQGGTGQSFDWGIAAQLSQQGHAFLLAGGLTPDNVAQAIATVGPWGVDVSSGVETGGVKDPDKIRVFIQTAKQGDS